MSLADGLRFEKAAVSNGLSMRTCSVPLDRISSPILRVERAEAGCILIKFARLKAASGLPDKQRASLVHIINSLAGVVIMGQEAPAVGLTV